MCIFILENDPLRMDEMRRVLRNASLGEVHVFNCFPRGVTFLSVNLPSVRLISLDHDLGGVSSGDYWYDPGMGMDMANYLSLRTPSCPVIVHTDNLFVRPAMTAALSGEGSDRKWDVHVTPPGNGVRWIEEIWLPKVRELLDS